ncbi:MAG: methyltransferase domain-containing protein [Acidimicrobiales bacterium]
MRRVTHHLPWAAVTAGVVANGLRLRARVARLTALDDAAVEIGDAASEYGVITGAGVEVDDATRAAAISHADRHDLDVLDLVPGDLHLDRLYELARLVNPKTYRDDRMAAGRGAGHATVVRRALLDQIGLRPGRTLDPVEYVEAIAELKHYAPTTTDLVVAPGLRAVALAPEWRLPRLRALYGGTGSILAVLPIAQAAALSLGAVASRGRGVPAIAAHLAQPFLVGTGGPVTPSDLAPAGGLGRVGRDVRDTVRSLRTPPPAAVRHRAEQTATDDETRRAQYARLMQRTAAFFEPAVAHCPWCGGDDLRLRVEVPDLLQGKPGRFRLDECGGCGHVFQNPRLSIEGLDFYYRDFYDGLGDEETAFIFSMNRSAYRARAKMLEAVARPKRWLDVGAGHGHFCLEAQAIWPETTFDGLDLSGSVITAERRGWIERAYKGLFPDLAPDLVGAYDVVSMHHYLEHTRDPTAEIDAAHLTLEDGGHLLIEVPDPECRVGRVLRGAWGPWFQPQHQHLVPLGNLSDALDGRGFTVVTTERGPAHQPLDLTFAVWLTFNRVAPAGDRPWNPRPTAAQRAGRAVAGAVAAPLLAGALAADQVVAPALRRLPKLSNTYRVLARKD